ncbi:MAG: hypothetical protein N2560_09765, partial [Ignavibacteria bacterium]|nr:hypothetical protein [Ignavibacteria bacterium]
MPLLAKRKFTYFFLLWVFGLLPLILFGFFSITNGGYFFPNSVILKGNLPEFSTLKGIIKFFGGYAFY